MEEPTYTYDDYRQDVLAEEAMRQFDAHEAEVIRLGSCPDPDCYHHAEPCEDF